MYYSRTFDPSNSIGRSFYVVANLQRYLRIWWIKALFARHFFFCKVVLFAKAILCRAFSPDSGRMRIRVIDLSRDFIPSPLFLVTLQIPSSVGPRFLLFVFPRYVTRRNK